MIVDPFVKAAFGILKVADTSFDENKFREEMKKIFDASGESGVEVKKQKMMEAVRQGIMGEKLAKIASYIPKTSKSFPELIQENTEATEFMEELYPGSSIGVAPEVSAEGEHRQQQ